MKGVRGVGSTVAGAVPGMSAQGRGWRSSDRGWRTGPWSQPLDGVVACHRLTPHSVVEWLAFIASVRRASELVDC